MGILWFAYKKCDFIIIFNYTSLKKKQKQGEMTEPRLVTASVTRQQEDPMLPDSVGPSASSSFTGSRETLRDRGHLSDPSVHFAALMACGPMTGADGSGVWGLVTICQNNIECMYAWHQIRPVLATTTAPAPGLYENTEVGFP